MRSSVQVWNDNVLDKPLVREDQVVAVVVEKDELAEEEKKRAEAVQAAAEAEAKAAEFTKAGVGADFLEDLLSGNLKDAEEL